MTFYEIFARFLREQMVPGNIDEIINTEEKGYQVIVDFLRTHGKESAFPIAKKYLNINSYRFNHILETFAIGWSIISSESIGYIFKDYFVDANHRDAHYQIDDCWLMVSLLHDSAYFFDANYDTNQIKAYLSKFYNKKFICPTYDINTLDYYYKMMEKYPVQEKHEHGIVSAISAFNSLSSNWYRNVNKMGGLDENGFAIDATNSIIYRRIDLRHFQIVCKSIAQHNLYKCKINDERYSYYSEFGLEELLNPSVKINIADTMTYLLSIVDTIEFTKTICRYSGIKPSEVAKRLDVDYAHSRIAICYSDLYEIIDDKTINKYVESIMQLNNWLDINVVNVPESKTLFLIINIV